MSVLIDDLSTRREKNIKEFEEFLQDFYNSEEGKKAKIVVEKYKDVSNPQPVVKKKRRQTDVFRAKIKIPLERRYSSRLKNVQPQYTYDDLPDETTIARKIRQNNYDYDLNDLETVTSVPTKKRISTSNKLNNFVLVPVESITEEYLANIATNSTKKKYDTKNGTSCHQCRQKTADSKTYCRNKNCVGIRGQFCGPCLRNRYGEEAAVALKDPNWSCPVCRGICNCSFCRNKLGKRPTGILAPVAQRNGHASVHHLLLELNGFGDNIEEPKTDDYEIDKIEHDHNICLTNLKELDKDIALLGFCDVTQEPVHSTKEIFDRPSKEVSGESY